MENQEKKLAILSQTYEKMRLALEDGKITQDEYNDFKKRSIVRAKKMISEIREQIKNNEKKIADNEMLIFFLRSQN